MGIHNHMALFASASLYAPLQHLSRAARRRLDRWQLARMGRDTARVVALATPMPQRPIGLIGQSANGPANPVPTHAQTTTDRSGRVVISGRMADVCAELARLVELEALTQSDAVH